MSWFQVLVETGGHAGFDTKTPLLTFPVLLAQTNCRRLGASANLWRFQRMAPRTHTSLRGKPLTTAADVYGLLCECKQGVNSVKTSELNCVTVRCSHVYCLEVSLSILCRWISMVMLTSYISVHSCVPATSPLKKQARQTNHAVLFVAKRLLMLSPQSDSLVKVTGISGRRRKISR